MNILYWIIIGLIAGVLAKALTPGTSKEPKGCLMTMALGIAGSVLVGFIVNTFLGGGAGGFIPTLIGATIGAVLLILLMRKFWA
jgi:uncharacterized membrane protein YeaQ/YmgE (transglycosylase-associated protein family)